MARRRQRPEPHVNHERWLVSYATSSLCLFAFFTTTYAISTVDAQKMSRMVASMPIRRVDLVVLNAATSTAEEPGGVALAR